MKSKKKNNLIKEQNKSLIMICVVFIVLVGIIGFIVFNPISDSKKDTEDNIIRDDGVVDDLGVIRGK